MKAIRICPTHNIDREYLPKEKQYICRACSRERALHYHRRIRDTHQASINSSWHRSQLLGIPSQEVPALIAALLDHQDHRCPICTKTIDHRADLDHDHNTMAPRGLLCRRCNAAIAIFDDHERLLAASEYIRQYNPRRTAVSVLPRAGAPQ